MYLSTEPNLDEAVIFALGYARRKWTAPGLDMGAVESAAMQGAWNAFKTFDTGRKAKWCTYLHNMVEWHIRKGQRSKHDKLRAAGAFASLDEVDGAYCYETLDHLALRDALDTLEPREREVVTMLHCKRYTKREIIEHLGQGWNLDRLNQVEQSGLAKLRMVLA